MCAAAADARLADDADLASAGADEDEIEAAAFGFGNDTMRGGSAGATIESG